jgi:hypothetical protein
LLVPGTAWKPGCATAVFSEQGDDPD